MAAPYTLAELLSAQSSDQLRAKFLAILGADPFPGQPGNYNHGFPVADWLSNPLGMEMALVNMVRLSLYDLVTSKMGQQIAGGWLAKATGDWLAFHASTFYEVERNPATKTVFKLSVSSVVSAPPYDFEVGDVQVRGVSGSVYVSTSGGHLEPGGVLVVTFEAGTEGSAANDNPTIVPPTLVTAFAGVSVSASVGDFTDVYHQGDGTGRVEFGRLFATPPVPGTYRVRIDQAGDPGVAHWSLSTDGTNYNEKGILGLTVDVPTYGIRLRAFAGAATPASFLAGDVYVSTSPGGTGYVQGNDPEGDESLAARCRARWPSISLNQTAAVFELWTKEAAPSVSRVAVRADPLVPGRIQIIAADSHGGVDPTALTTIGAYINQRLGSVLDSISVAPATNRQAIASGQVYVTALTVAAIQQAVVTGWTAYLATVPIGGIVILAELQQLIMDAGAVDTSVALNDEVENLVLGPDEIPVPVDVLSELNWVFV